MIYFRFIFWSVAGMIEGTWRSHLRKFLFRLIQIVLASPILMISLFILLVNISEVYELNLQGKDYAYIPLIASIVYLLLEIGIEEQSPNFEPSRNKSSFVFMVTLAFLTIIGVEFVFRNPLFVELNVYIEKLNQVVLLIRSGFSQLIQAVS